MFELKGKQYTLAQVEAAAAKSNKTLEEYIEKAGLVTLEPGKTTPTTPDAVVEETAASDQNNTALQSEDGSSEPPKENSFWAQLRLAWEGGSVATEYDDFLSPALYSNEAAQSMSSEDLAELTRLFKKEDALSQTEGEKAWDEAYDKYEAEGSSYMPDFLYATIRATIDEGIDSFALLGTRSLAKMFSGEVLGYGAAGSGLGAAAGAAKGAAIGAIGGSVIPGAGTAAGAGLGSGVGAVANSAMGFFTGMGAGVELFGSLAESIKQDLPENYTKEDIAAFFQDEEKLRKARNRAITRSGTIALIDLIAAKGAGKAVTSIGKKALAKGLSKRTGAVLAGAAATGIGSTGEFTGELAAQAFAGDDIDFKEAVLEVVGISPTVVTQAGAAKQFISKPKYKIGNKEVSREDINNFIDDNDGLDLAKVSLDIKNDDVLLEKANKKTRVANNKVQVDKRITDDAQRERIAELEYEKQQLDGNSSRTSNNRKKEINSEIDSIQQQFIKPGRPTKAAAETRVKIESEQAELQEAIKQRVIDAVVGKTTKFAETAGKQIGLETNILNNTEEFITKLEKDGVKLTKAQLSKVNQIGGAAIGNRIYINKEAAAKTGQINVGAHEVLHPILNAKIFNQENPVEIINQFKQRLNPNQLNTMENLMKKYSGDKYNTEYLNVFSDALTKNQIKFEENLFQKIGDFIVSLLKPFGYTNISFKDGKGVYNFMKEYNKNVKKGKLSKATIKAIGGPITSEQANLQFSVADQDFVQNLGVNQDLAQWKQRGADLAIERMYTAGVFEKLIGSKITSQMRQLPDFNQEDFIMDTIGELIPHIRNFNPEVNDNLSGWINSQLRNKINSVLKKGQVTQEQFTTDISEIEERTEFVNDEIEDMAAVIAAENERLESLINPLDILPNDLKNAYIDAVKKALKDKDLNTLTFKNLNDLAPEITAEFFGIPVKKVTNAAANLKTGEIPAIQEILRNNAKILLALLPDGSIKEAASEQLINTGTLVPRKILQAFYEKQKRTTLGAGLFPFELKRNLTVQDFYKPFGIKPDGGLTKLGGQTPQAQSMLAMIRLTGKLMTNTTVRSLIELQNDQAGVINLNIGAGTSEAQLSIADEVNTYQEGLKNLVTTNAGAIKSLHGLTDEQVSLLAETSTLLADKSNGAQTYRAEDLEKFLDLQDKFRLFMPPAITNIYGLKGLLNSYTANHYRINSYGVTFIETHMKKLVDENGDRILSTDKRAQEIKKRFDAAIRNEFYNEIDNTAKYSKETQNLIDDFIDYISGKRIKLLNYSNLNIIKGQGQLNENLNNIFTELANDEANIIRQKLFQVLKALETDFVNNSKIGSQERFDRLFFSKQLAAANAQIINGEKSLSILEGGIVYDGLIKAWYHEHMDASLNTSIKGFENVLLQKYDKIKSRSLIISAADAKAMDKAIGKTASYKEKLQWLKENSKGNLVTKNGLQLSLADEVENMIERTAGIDSKAEISDMRATMLGKNKGKWKFFVPPSADDLMGLMYYMVGKGKQGNKDLAWIKQNIADPFAKGINEFTQYRQNVMREFRNFKKNLRSSNVKLKETNSTGYTNETAVRVYIWAKRGIEVPGLTESEVNELLEVVNNNTQLQDFGKQILNLTANFETPAPEGNWNAGTITTDILDHINTSARESFLENYLANVEEIFGKFGQSGKLEGPIANKLRAAYGDNYIEALSDVLYRMKVGRARPVGANRLTNTFTNWVNDSVGAIMFFNTRSALLQQLSIVNFINFSDNNPLAVAKAFTNQKQFWADYAMLFNSDFLKERRSGLKTDVNADEIARAAEEGRNPIRSVIAKLLKKGFLPTQLADSHAIAIGGASFYRNRLNRYLSEGMSQEQAEQQAFLDFQESAEESQQSSRPDKISQQQASVLGRIILAFANTPMQYARLTKKAALDLMYKRGDWKTNLSKLMYYGAVQNIVFSSLQSALFALLFDDEEEEEVRNRYFRIANSSTDGLLRGLGFGGAAVSTVKNMVLEAIKQSKANRPNYEKAALKAISLSPPVDSKIRKLMSAGRAFTYRNTREKMAKEGFSLDNPAFEALGQVVSATTNLPADRVIRKLDNLTTPVRQDVETWQAISLALGYSKWDVGLIEKQTKKSPKGIKKTKKKKSIKK